MCVFIINNHVSPCDGFTLHISLLLVFWEKCPDEAFKKKLLAPPFTHGATYDDLVDNGTVSWNSEESSGTVDAQLGMS